MFMLCSCVPVVCRFTAAQRSSQLGRLAAAGWSLAQRFPKLHSFLTGEPHRRCLRLQYGVLTLGKGEAVKGGSMDPPSVHYRYDSRAAGSPFSTLQQVLEHAEAAL
jgi:hypothetical protein